MNVLLVGDYPPPYGGISVQLQSLQTRIEQEPGISCVVLNVGASRRKLIPGCVGVSNHWGFMRMLWRYARQGYILHIVTNGHNLKSWLCAFACSMAGIVCRRKTIIALDSGAMAGFVEEAGWLLRMLMRVTLQFAGKVICRNSRSRDVLLKLGSKNSAVLIIPGYIPAALSGPDGIPSEIKTFLTDHTPVIGTIVAFRPEYGVDLLIAAVNQLVTDYPNVGLVIIGSGDESSSGKAMQNLDASRAIVTKDLPHPQCLAVLSRLDIFARCTYYDGDAISVREALALGLSVVASDTDFRPEGVVKFRVGDVQDLVCALRYALEHSDEITKTNSGHSQSGGVETVIRLYGELMAEDE